MRKKSERYKLLLNEDAGRWLKRLRRSLPQTPPRISPKTDTPQASPVLVIGLCASFLSVYASARYENLVLPARMDDLRAELQSTSDELGRVNFLNGEKDKALKELQNTNKDWSDRNDALRKANRQLQESITDNVLTYGRGQIYCRAERQFYTVRQVQQNEAVRNLVAVGRVSGNCIGALDQ